MSTETISTVIIPLTLRWSEKLPNILTLEGPQGIIRDDQGNEVYLDEHDGLSLCFPAQALQSVLPQGATIESNNRNEAWIAHWDDEALKALGGRTFEVRMERHYDAEGDATDEGSGLL